MFVMDKKYGVKMFKICVLLPVILLNGLVCGNPTDSIGPPGPPHHHPPPGPYAENIVAVPVYVIYIFGFVLLLLVLLLIFLVVILLKAKILDIFDKNKTAVNKVEQQTNTDTVLTEVKSMKRLNLDRSNSFEFKIRDVDSTATLKLVKNQQGPITPTNSESSGNLSPRIMKCVIKDMPIILPEQMSQICKEVLIRTNKNEDAGGSLNNIDQLANETLPEEEKDKKYSSTPVLDIYDVLPTTSQNGKKRVEENSITNKDERDTAKNTNKSPNLDTNDESSPDEIYDMPKEVKASALNYIEACFLSDPASQAKRNPEECTPKPAYALLSDLLNGENSRDDFKENQECDHYNFPKTDSENLLYINANCNSFSSLSSIDNKKE